MKKSFLAILLMISVNVFAQKQHAFFSSDSAGIKHIAELVMETTKNKYQFEKVIPKRYNVEYWYRADPHTLIRVHFQIFEDRSAILKGLSGKYEDLFPFWKKYFQEDVDEAVMLKAGGAKSAGTTIPIGLITYRFHKVGSIWQILPYTLVPPAKQ